MPTADEIRLALSLYSTHATVGFNPNPTSSETESMNKAIDGLLTAGLLDEVQPGTYEGNEALTLWVEALALVPFPVQKWIIPPYAHPAAYED